MARGKNYVNGNRGVHLESKNGSSNNGNNNGSQMKQCEYGKGCTRPDCIYRHDENTNGANNKDKEPQVCVLFLAGKCSFKDKGCRKRHPSKDECARLLAKYKRIRCRFGDECYTDSCLFLHPRDMKDQDPVSFIEPHHFPPLGNKGGQNNNGAKPIPNSAWNSVPPNNNYSEKADPSYQQGQQQQQQLPRQQGQQQQPNHAADGQQHPVPQAGWGYPPNNHPMMMPPPPHGYYGGPPPPGTMIDPNTGYPVQIDPAYFEAAAAAAGHNMMYLHHPGMLPPPMPYGVPMVGGGVVPMGVVPFNAEAKEFVPGGVQ
jgi:hypothetical protein